MGKVIALLTDFGVTDTYVGVMKAVMLDICPDAQFVDLTHAIEPQNIRHGAFALLNSFRYLPANATCLVVVDPGVGGDRRPIAVRTEKYDFVAPDNGVLSYALEALGGTHTAVELMTPAYRLTGPSATFHGRDIFAPATAYLASGVPLQDLGQMIDQLVKLEPPLQLISGDLIEGEVLHVDHFGNLVTSIGLFRWESPQLLRLLPTNGDSEQYIRADRAVVEIGGQELRTLQRNFSQAEVGDPLAYIGSSGYLEVGINQGSFAQHFEVQPGDPVAVMLN
jgi:S-adenosylmethionine hydrolase